MLKLVATYEEEQANKVWLESSTMACPGCQIHVEKSLGCNHVYLTQTHITISADRNILIDDMFEVFPALLLPVWYQTARCRPVQTLFNDRPTVL